MHDYRCAVAAGLAAVAALAAVPAKADAAIPKSAGWHGREIRAPYARLAERDTDPQLPSGWSAGPVARGTGYAHPRGSRRVRELQRRLTRRGYRPGPADGRFGPRTRAAVLWFQVKHGLPRTGRGDALTVTRLRAPKPALARPPVAAAAAISAPPVSSVDTDAALFLGLVVLIGLAAIIAWVRTALRRAPEPPAHVTLEPPPRRPLGPPRVLGYVALEDSADLDASARLIGAWCEARDWTLTKVVHDVLPARGRPGLRHVIDEIGAGRATGLVVERLRDLTSSLTELGPLLQWFVDADAFVIALDYELDTSSREGELATRALVEVSAWERGRVADRNAGRRGAASAAAVSDDPELAARIAAMRAGGMSLQAIADALNEAGVPTLRGGSRWRPSSVQAATGYKRPPARLPRLTDD